MKHTISKLVLTLLCAVVGLTSCVKDDLDDLKTYGSTETLTNWQSEYTEDGTVYTISIKLNEKGDTTAVLYSDEDSILYVCPDGVCSYNAKAGMTTIDFEETPIGYPIRMYLARQSDSNRMTVYVMGIVDYDGTEYEVLGEKFNAVRTKGCVVEGLTYEDAADSLYILFLPNGSCKYETGDGVEKTGQYTYTSATGEGTLTLADGTVYALKNNDKNQLVLIKDDTEHVLEVLAQ